MPQIKAAKKSLRKANRQRTVNDRWRRRVREAIVAVREAIGSDDHKAAEAAYIKAQSTIDRAARRSVMHRRKANRQKKTLSRAIAKQD